MQTKHEARHWSVKSHEGKPKHQQVLAVTLQKLIDSQQPGVTAVAETRPVQCLGFHFDAESPEYESVKVMAKYEIATLSSQGLQANHPKYFCGEDDHGPYIIAESCQNSRRESMIADGLLDITAPHDF